MEFYIFFIDENPILSTSWRFLFLLPLDSDVLTSSCIFSGRKADLGRYHWA